MSKKHENLLPEIRFPEFRDTGDWDSNLLDEIYSFKVTNSLSRDKLNYESGKVKNIHYGDIHTKFSTLFNIEKEVVPFINPSEPLGKIKKDCYCEEGDMIFADASEDLDDVGKSIEIVSLNNEKLVAGLHTLLARQEESKLVIGFAGHLFKSNRIREQIKKEAQGAKVLGISAGRISKVKVVFPSDKKEQAKIADCLSSLDSLICANATKLDTLKSYKKGLMQNLFPAKGETVPALRFPEFKNAEDWMKLSIQNLVDKDFLLPPKDGNHGSIHPKSSDFVKSGIPFIMASNLKNGKIDFWGCSKLKKEQADTLQKGFSEVGDILLSHKGTVGEVAVVPENDFPYIMLTPQVTYYRVKNKKKINNHYLASAFLSEQFQNELTVVSGGGTRAYIGITEQRKLQLWVPENIKEQKIIADYLSSIDGLINAQAQKIEELIAHKNGLMQQLFPTVDEVIA